VVDDLAGVCRKGLAAITSIPAETIFKGVNLIGKYGDMRAAY
jgi:hypothetical protein